MITEDYCSFEIAKLLKEKGFDELCHCAYHCWTCEPPFYHHKMKNFNGDEYKGLNYEWFSAPTLQMAMKWLREKHWVISINPMSFDTGGECHWYKADIWGDDNYQYEYNNGKETYESACEDAIKWVLTNWF